MLPNHSNDKATELSTGKISFMEQTDCFDYTSPHQRPLLTQALVVPIKERKPTDISNF